MPVFIRINKELLVYFADDLFCSRYVFGFTIIIIAVEAECYQNSPEPSSEAAVPLFSSQQSAGMCETSSILCLSVQFVS